MTKKKSEMWDYIMQFWKKNHNCEITLSNYQNSTFNLQIVRSVIAIHCFPMVKMDHSPSCCITYGFGGFQGCVQPRKNGANLLLNGNGGALNTLFWWRKCCSYGSWEGHSLCSFWIIFCKIHSMLQSLPLPSRIKQNIPIEWRDLWKLWFLIIVIQHLPNFRMKRQTFQVKDNPLLTSGTVLWSKWPYYFYCEY